jgi:hypothetical protein
MPKLKLSKTMARFNPRIKILHQFKLPDPQEKEKSMLSSSGQDMNPGQN